MNLLKKENRHIYIYPVKNKQKQAGSHTRPSFKRHKNRTEKAKKKKKNFRRDVFLFAFRQNKKKSPDSVYLKFDIL